MSLQKRIGIDELLDVLDGLARLRARAERTCQGTVESALSECLEALEPAARSVALDEARARRLAETEKGGGT